MVSVTECPVCKNHSIKLFLQCTDFTVSHETFSVNRCQVCGLGITSPRPEVENLGSYYKSDEYISHSGKTSGGIGLLYKTVRSFALNWKARIVDQKNENPSALDFGCGTGEFLQTLKKRGWKVEGVEPSDDARSKAEALCHQKINSSLALISDQRFDVISAWHVIEHVPDLTETIQRLTSLLKKDGTIFIAVPNYESADAKQYEEFWAAYDVPRHLWHFSKKSMTQLLATYGLEMIKIQPMKLDAYYVSMLSEKYKRNANPLANLIRGFISGFKSNLAGRRDRNHSSLIYIARHT
jgi:2-polyprenyl-3-methyl-5-hydroxy-6-metoxy-1,4-benzoquinol methylase